MSHVIVESRSADFLEYHRSAIQNERAAAKASQEIAPCGQIAADWWQSGIACTAAAGVGAYKEVETTSGVEIDDDDVMQGVRLEAEVQDGEPKQSWQSRLPVREH